MIIVYLKSLEIGMYIVQYLGFSTVSKLVVEKLDRMMKLSKYMFGNRKRKIFNEYNLYIPIVS